jgi:2-oxoglutarate ferredoxin oxidoreductase subunit beta
MLATLQRPEFPVPIGVFRSVERPTYEDMLQAQVDSAIAQRGRGNLKALLHSGDTWQI